MTLSHAFSPTQEPSRAQLASVPGQPSVNALSGAQYELSPEISASAVGPNIYNSVKEKKVSESQAMMAMARISSQQVVVLPFKFSPRKTNGQYT